MHISVNKIALLAILLGSSIYSMDVSAETTNAVPDYKLDDVNVTAARMEDKIVDTPADVYVISAQKIADRRYQSVSEALNDAPGVSIRHNGFAGDEEHVFINGDDRVVIMVDGRRLNLDKGTSGRSGFDMSLVPSPQFIERIEVVKGAGSSLYGSDAVAGVINIITKSGTANKPQIVFDANTGSWGTHNYNVSVSGKEKRTGYFVTLAKAQQNHVYYKDANSNHNVRWPDSSSDKQSATVKLDQDLGKDQLLTLYFSHVYKYGGRPYEAPGSGNPYSQYSPNSWATGLNNDVSLKYTWNKDKNNAGYMQIYKNYYAGNFMSESNFSDYNEKKEGIDIQQDFKLGDKHQLVSGLEWRESTVDTPDSYDRKGKINTKAIYLQDIWALAKSWNLTTGVRYDKHNYFGNKTTMHAAINKKFDDNNRAYFSWGQVFKAPTADDLFWTGIYTYGNPNLKPEKGNVYTLGYDSQIDKKTGAGISMFYSDLKDAINWAVDPNSSIGAWTPSNVDEQKKRGLTIYLNHQFDNNWSADFNYTYVKSESSTSGSDYNRDYNILPNQYKFGVKYTKNKWLTELYGRGANGAAKTSYADSRWLTLDLVTQYKVNKGLNAYLKVYNLTNAAYAENGGVYDGTYEHPMPGRSFLIGMQYSF